MQNDESRFECPARLTRLALALALIVVPHVASAQEAQNERGRPLYRVDRTGDSVRIDGVLDDAPWNGAPTFELTYETRPAENEKAPVRTEVWITYDDANLYAAFRRTIPRPRRSGRGIRIATRHGPTTSSDWCSTRSTTSGGRSSSSSIR